MTILATIIEQKHREVARLPAGTVDVSTLERALQKRGGLRNFAAALHHPRHGRLALIAEIKKASPSAGVIRPDFDPLQIARDYQAAGADCLSVLTDEPFFQGSLASLRQIRETVPLPLLRKDFIIDERQILEAAEWGADAILLIVAILTDAQLNRFHSLATQAGLATLVEVHDAAELDRARAAGARIIGVNNRDLRTFHTNLAHTERLAPAAVAPLPDGARPLLVAESGIRTRHDVERLERCGARAMLVGESLMREADLSAKVRELLGIQQTRSLSATDEHGGT